MGILDESEKIMNGLGCAEFCRLFLCPPCPSKIAAKVAFLPPEPSYTIGNLENSTWGYIFFSLVPDDSGQRFQLHLSDRAEWQHGQREKDLIEVFYAKTRQGHK